MLPFDHLLEHGDAMTLAVTCTLLGSIMTVVGFKVAPAVRRWYKLFVLKMLIKFNTR